MEWRSQLLGVPSYWAFPWPGGGGRPWPSGAGGEERGAEPGLESPLYGLMGGAPASPTRPPHFLSAAPAASPKIHGKSMGSHGFPWVSMGSHGVPWGPMGSPWLPWKIQECRKSWILMKTTIRFDRKLETRGPNRCAIFFRSILSRQNALNRHMEQNTLFWPKI